MGRYRICIGLFYYSFILPRSKPGLPFCCREAGTKSLHSCASTQIWRYKCCNFLPYNPAGFFFPQLSPLPCTIFTAAAARPYHNVTHMSAVLLCRLHGSIRAALVCSMKTSILVQIIGPQNNQPLLFSNSLYIM